MLKFGYNFFIQSKAIQSLRVSEAIRNFYFNNGLKFGRNYFHQVKLRTVFRSTEVPPTYQNYFPSEKPMILLSGILSYFGIKTERPPEEDELIMRIKKGILLIQNGEYEEAETMLHWALELAQKENDEDGITFVYDTLANLAFETGDHSKAEKLFVSVLQRLLSKGEEQDSNKVIHISLKLAKIFQDTKEFEKAEDGFNFCIETTEKKLDEGDEDTLALWGMSMDWYARFLLEIGRKEEAFKCFKKAYEMCVKLNGMEHEQTAILLNDLGTVASLMGDNETAMNYFEAARDIGSKLSDMKDLAAIYINLGQLYLLREMYKESKKACEEGYKLASNFNDEIGVTEAKECLDSINKVFKATNKKEFKLNDSVESGIKTSELVN